MKGPTLELINLGGLIQKLNSNISESEVEIKLGDFVPKRKNAFFYRGNRKLETRGTYPLIQPSLGEILFGPISDFESGVELGYVLVETGLIDRASSYSGGYEIVRLRIKYPLELRNGYIPNSSVELLRETGKWEKPNQERRDYIYKLDFLRSKADLSKVLPTEWFLPERTFNPNYNKQ